jgi:hypothetical protein
MPKHFMWTLRALLTLLQLLYGYRLRFGIITAGEGGKDVYLQTALSDNGTTCDHCERCNTGVEESVERACIFGRLDITS